MMQNIVQKNKKRIYLDYAATTPLDQQVLKVMQPYFSEKFGNPGSLHSFGQEASQAVFHARRIIADVFGCNYNELIFTGSATEGNNLALRSVIGKKKFSFKPRIIVSTIEHESILKTCETLEKEGVEVIKLPVTKEGYIRKSTLRDAINSRTVLVSIMYANNEIGSIQPIQELAKYIKSVREKQNSIYPLFHTDAVQALQYLDCNVNNIGVDIMTVSAHKIYGPKGIGALYIRKEVQDEIQSLIMGGGQEFGLRSGTENVPLIIGFSKAVEISEKLKKKENIRIKELRDFFLNELKKKYPNAQLNGPQLIQKKRLPNNVNIYFPKTKAQELLIYLDLAGIAVSAGSACSARAVEPSPILHALGYKQERIEGSIRFTLGRQTKKTDILTTIGVLKKSKKNSK